TNDFGQRIARNQLLILKNESHFDNTTNPADGTYYVENLTKQFAEKALVLFKEIEAGGGFVTQLIEGKIQKKIKEAAAKEQKAFDDQQKILVGTNAYVNSIDKMNDELELYPFVKINPRKTLLEPIIPKRLAEQLEQKRLKDE
ncbi:MAG: methylmalonyl-CoA mutase family protein, partial [Bacteroidota bacterium]|nr:methylmalonyl-CoA mutase family protein [Bacteroidota bacterium]